MGEKRFLKSQPINSSNIKMLFLRLNFKPTPKSMFRTSRKLHPVIYVMCHSSNNWEYILLQLYISIKTKEILYPHPQNLLYPTTFTVWAFGTFVIYCFKIGSSYSFGRPVFKFRMSRPRQTDVLTYTINLMK